MTASPSFLIFKAGAGSGKTFNLVQQYLMMALASGNDNLLRTQFSTILAITFTNKAANEMKERIWKHLDEIARGKGDAHMCDAICRGLDIDGGELKRRAGIMKSALLHNYSDLAVSTIDSFMQRIVRTFAHDLNLALNFNLELDSKYVANYIVDQLMALTGTEGNEALTQVLCRYGVEQMNDAKSNDIKYTLNASAQRLFNEDAAEYLKLLQKHTFEDFVQAYEQLKEENRKYARQCADSAAEALKRYDAYGLEEKDFPGKSRGIYSWLKKISVGNIDTELKGEALKARENRVLVSSDKQTSASLKMAEKLAPVLEVTLHAVDTVAEGSSSYNTRRMLLGNFYNMAVLSEMKRLKDDYYHENEITDLVEVSHKISNEVKNQPAPFLFERLGERYKHFLIDEFQDTSREQWHNLLPLILNGVSEGFRSLVVGDAKQAIYRFRQGDVHQFLALPHVDDQGDTVRAAESRRLALDGTSQTVTLKDNYRTRKAVVEFNNQFFAWLIENPYGDNPLLQEIYDQSAQQYKKEGGYVELSFCQPQEELADKESLYTEAYRIVREQLRKGYQPGDVTVLANNKKTLSELSSYLTLRGVRSSSSDSLLLYNSMAIRLILMLMRYLLNPAERAVQLQVLSYLRQLDLLKEDYRPLFFRRQRAGDNETYLFDLTAYLQQQGFDFHPQQLNSMSLYDCSEALLRCFHLGEKDPSFVASFLNFTARYSRSKRQNLGDFLDYFEEKADSLSSNAPTDAGAVRLMTVHKSKGLESPVIVYLLPSKKKRPDSHWVHVGQELSPIEVGLVYFPKDKPSAFDSAKRKEEMETQMDDVNRTYVALTRAKDKLFLVVEDKEAAKSPVRQDGAGLNAQLKSYAALCEASGKCRKQEEDGNDRFCFGDDSKKDTASHKSSDGEETWQEETLSQLSFGPWTSRVQVANQGSAILDGLPNENIRHGLQMHELLSRIRHADDVEAALQRYAAAGGLDKQEHDLLLHQLQALVRGIATAQFFAPEVEVKNECPLWFEGHELRPDRVVFAPGSTWVIDFKTGGASDQYHEQVATYCRAIASMGYPAVSGYLVYLGSRADARVEQIV